MGCYRIAQFIVTSALSATAFLASTAHAGAPGSTVNPTAVNGTMGKVRIRATVGGIFT